MLFLRQRWVKQKYQIMCQTYQHQRDDRTKGKVFIKLWQNVLKRKKKKYTRIAIKDFRKDMLLTRSFKGFKALLTESYKRKPIINYCTENMHTFETRDVYTNKSIVFDDSHRRKINYDANTCMFNEMSGFSSSQTPVQNNSRGQNVHINQLKCSDLTENKDDLLENIYERYITFKSRMMKTR